MAIHPPEKPYAVPLRTVKGSIPRDQQIMGQHVKDRFRYQVPSMRESDWRWFAIPGYGEQDLHGLLLSG